MKHQRINQPFVNLDSSGLPKNPSVASRRPQDQRMRIEDAEFIICQTLDRHVAPLEQQLNDADTSSGPSGPDLSDVINQLQVIYPEGQVLDDAGNPVDSVEALKTLVRKSNRLFSSAVHFSGQHLFIFELPVGYKSYPSELPMQEIANRGLLSHVRAEQNGQSEIMRGKGDKPKVVPNYGFVLSLDEAKLNRDTAGTNVVTVRLNNDYTAFTGWSAGTYTKDWPVARRSQLCRIAVTSEPVVTEVDAKAGVRATTEQPA